MSWKLLKVSCFVIIFFRFEFVRVMSEKLGWDFKFLFIYGWNNEIVCGDKVYRVKEILFFIF